MPETVDFGGELAGECAERADVEDVRVQGRLELRDGVALGFSDDLGEFSVCHLEALSHAIGDLVLRLCHEADATPWGSDRQNLAQEGSPGTRIHPGHRGGQGGGGAAP